MSYEQKYKGLEQDVAFMLVHFKETLNWDHGCDLLLQWDQIRSKYYTQGGE